MRVREVITFKKYFEELVVLMNGFQKKTQKTPKNQIEKALIIRAEYYEQKNKK
ncbi:MAG TPA: type II toxin-antitoxin system RelE/ParE family toxin [Sphingobacteriaceae bacterium]|nr:type II toxin-antitoxin system RelE/ParE family toxin [Sphingobacteriaceae bacterium]